MSRIAYLLLVNFHPSFSFNIFMNDLESDIKLQPEKKKIQVE